MLKEINVVGSGANIVRHGLRRAIDFNFVIAAGAAAGHGNVRKSRVAAPTADNRVRRVGVDRRPLA